MLGPDLPLAERDRGFQPCREPIGRLPVGLTLLENPVGGFRQVASGGTHCNGVALSAACPFEEVHDVLLAPVGVMALTDDDVGGFDESPFQVGVALFDHSSIVRLAGT